MEGQTVTCTVDRTIEFRFAADWSADDNHIAMDMVDVCDERLDQVAILPTTGGLGMFLWLLAAVPPILIAGLLRCRSRRLTGLHAA